MPRRYRLLAALAALFWGLGCGCSAPAAQPNPQPTTSPSAVHPLATAQPYRVAGYGRFTLSRIETATRIRTGQSGLMLQAGDGQVFVDIVLVYTNQSAQTLLCGQLLTVQAVVPDGTVHAEALYCVENDAHTRLISGAKVPHLATVQLHCILTMPKTEQPLTLLLCVQDQVFSRAYQLGETVGIPTAERKQEAGAQAPASPSQSTTWRISSSATPGTPKKPVTSAVIGLMAMPSPQKPPTRLNSQSSTPPRMPLPINRISHLSGTSSSQPTT
jgi:hypothetical protein